MGITVCVIGSGSTYCPELIDGFIKRKEVLKVDEIRLMDIDPERLDITFNMTNRMLDEAGMSVKTEKFTDYRKAISGCTYVVSQFREGGLRGRDIDESIPVKYDVVGQETTGPGGFFLGMRTIPVAIKIARIMEETAPEAWLINFTNPSGLVTEAIRLHSSIKCVGLCNVPFTFQNRIAKMLDVKVDSVYMDYFGLNHLTWIRRVFVDGKDVTKIVREKMDTDQFRDLTGYPFHKDLIDSLDLIPAGYLQFYYYKDEILKALKSAKVNRAKQVMEIDRQILESYKDVNLRKKPESLEQRGGAWYSDAACELINSIENDTSSIQYINYRNDGALGGLDKGVIIEGPAVIKSDGPHMLTCGELSPAIRALVIAAKNYELLTVKAALSMKYYDALLALVNNPLVENFNQAKSILDDVIVSYPEYFAKLGGQN